MMFSTLLDKFSNKPVIDEGSRAWIFDTFAWAVENLDGSYFKNKSELILPTNEFYPGKVSSVEEMAETIFSATLKYSGLQNWPIELASPQSVQPSSVPKLSFAGSYRGEKALISQEQANAIPVPYQPLQVNQPQDFVSSLVQVLSVLMIKQQDSLPPGGQEAFAQTVDLVAVFMGFGVVFSNTAYQFKGGCGSCNNRNINRQAALPELETVYALALFCTIKKYDHKKVLPHLKSHLRTLYKRSHRDIAKYIEANNTATINMLIS